ncbi:MAG: bactofilin family protein [Parasphingopyxis sp.]|uniref:bactofilin family protein n=1 Tax=Parasphingopyxis sp. TaxID=1920299 RepID=UPI003F9F65C1
MAIPSSADNRSTFSVIGSDVTVTGDIDASVDLHVDGRVEGDIRCATLVQAGNSTIKGAVSAEQARIAGRVEGSIAAKELIVEASAKVIGDVTYEKLSIATGGHVEGSFRHKSAGTLKKEEPKDPSLKLVDEKPAATAAPKPAHSSAVVQG